MRRITIPRERGQAAAISRLESDGNSRSHKPDSPRIESAGNLYGIQMSGSIHRAGALWNDVSMIVMNVSEIVVELVAGRP
jgi:hypothetical protein